MLSRRTFFLSSFASTVAGLRAQNPKLRLGFDTYSMRAWGMKSLQHLDFAAKHGCNAIQISSLYDFESLDPSHLAKVKAKGKELDIAIDAGTGCICPTAKAWKPSFGDPVENLTKALKIAHLVGARSLRCYLGDAPVFLSEDGTIMLFRKPAALEAYLADPAAANSLSGLGAWATIRDAVAGGEASVIAGPENTYRLDGLDEALLDGPLEVDADQLSLAAELLADAAAARKDDEVSVALSTATALGNLVRAATQPDPDRMPPSPPFDDEVAAWRVLVETFEGHLTWK